VLAGALGAAACDGKEPAPPAPSASAAAPLPSASATPVRTARVPPRHPEVACRALSVTGKVHPLGSDQLLKSAGTLDGRTWLELDKGARMTLRHSRSGRELVVTGPGLVLACRDGEEQFLLAKGGIDTTMGPGARPGAEVLVATPLGTVRYGDASAEIRATGRRVDILARAGMVTLEAASGAKLKGPARLVPKSKATITGNPAPEALVEACEELAKQAEGLARDVISGSGAGPDGGPGGKSLGERAAAHVTARQKARGACTTASAAAVLAPEADRAGLMRRVAAADQRWKAVPRPPGAAGR
jgi:hypothetical protein